MEEVDLDLGSAACSCSVLVKKEVHYKIGWIFLSCFTSKQIYKIIKKKKQRTNVSLITLLHTYCPVELCTPLTSLLAP